MNSENRIQVVLNSLECGFFIELGDRQITLTAIRQTADRAAHVVFAVSNAAASSSAAAIEYSPQQLIALVQEASPFFWNWLGVSFPQ